jgi:hypothetical protein
MAEKLKGWIESAKADSLRTLKGLNAADAPARMLARKTE